MWFFAFLQSIASRRTYFCDMNFRNAFGAMLIFVGMISDSYAQSTIRGEIFSRQENTPIPYANVLLMKASDSSFIKGTVSNPEGIFELHYEDSAKCLLVVSILGYKESEIISITQTTKLIQLVRIFLEEDIRQLSEIIVQGQKPLFEALPGRLVVNVKDNITTQGKSALELLRQSPGIVVDPNGTINLNGKIGAAIMLNGRLINLNQESLLAGLSAGNIEKIELIYSPDARFNSEGEAGIISITTSEAVDVGLNGSIFASAGYYWRPKYGVGGNINFVKSRFSMSAQFSFNRNYSRTTWDNYIKYKSGEDSLQLIGLNTREEKNDDYSSMLQMDYRLNEKITIGGNFFMGVRDYLLDGDAPSYKTRNTQLEEYTHTVYSENNKWSRFGSNLNFRHAISKTSQLSIDADYLYFYNSIPVLYNLQFYDADYLLRHERVMRTQKTTPITVRAIKIDYAKTFSAKVNVAAGVNIRSSYFDNTFSVDTLAESRWVYDDHNSSRYMYHEKVPAAYVSVDLKPTEADAIVLGIRYEATRMDILSEDHETSRTFVNLFPHLSWTRSKTSGSFNVTFSRRLNRPGYWDLAPFAIFLGSNVFVSGNESLRPSLSNSLTFGYGHKKLDLSLNYNFNQFTIANYQNYVNTDLDMLMSNAQNIRNANSLYLNLKVPFSVGKVWESFNTIAGFHEMISVQYPYFQKPVEKDLWGYKVGTTNTFMLPKKFKVEVSGNYNSTYLVGISEVLGFGTVNLGLSKQMKSHILSLNISDILWTWSWYRDTLYSEENLNVSVRYKQEPRVITLTYRYSFGNDKVKGLKKRNTASEDEQSRI
jgi:hypothetical protein